MYELAGGQLSLFESLENREMHQDDASIKQRKSVVWHLFIDGAARRNPGPAGAGIYILKDGMPFYQDGYYLGEQTNNQAEYMGLLLGLYFVEQWKHQQDLLHIFSDSQLLVRQIQGIYRVRNADLQIKHAIALRWLQSLKGTVVHIFREKNSHADSMANQGIDLKKPLPASFTTRVHTYEIGVR